MSRYSPILATVRSLQLLEALAGRPGLAVADLAKQTGLSSAHVWKILMGLESAGYVRRNPTTGVYLLTYKIVALGRRHADAVRFVDLCQPHLEALARKTTELVQLAVLEGDALRFVAKADGTERITVRSLLGTEVDLHATGTGKAWLSTLPEDEAVELVRRRGLPRITTRTVTSLKALRLALRSVRKLGYALIEEEHLEGANAVAAPIVPAGATRGIGAVVLTGPTFRLSPSKLARLAPLVKATARELAALWSDVNPGARDSGPAAKSRLALNHRIKEEER